jgi:hypothetical protein
MGIFKLIRAFRKVNGRSPTPSELAKLKQQAEEMSTQENVIPFPGGGKDKRSPFDDFKASEDAYEQSQKLTPSRIKGGISTKIKLNGPNENKQYAKDLIGGKSAEYNSLKPEDRKELLDLLEAQIKKDTNPIGPPIDPDDMPFADGGRAGFNVGGLSKLLKMLQGKVGKKNITTADKIARPESALNREMFGEFNERVNRKILDVPSMPGGFQLSREKLLKNFPELDEAMADEIMGLDKELQGRVLTMLKDRRKNPDAYDKLLMEKGDTLDFQGEFDRSVKRSKNAAGGLAGLLGEEPRSEYGAGGGAGAPPVTYDDNIDNIGPGPTMPPNTMMNTPAIDPRLFNQGLGSGININPRALQNGTLQIPTQGLANGGRPKYGIGNLVKEKIPPEYRLYAKSILPGGESGKVDESYFTEDFKKTLRTQALEKFKQTGELKGSVNQFDQIRGFHNRDEELNKLVGMPSTYASLGAYSYEIDPKTLDVKIKDRYDWNPSYGKIDKNRIGFINNKTKEGRDVDLTMMKDFAKNAIKEGRLDKANALELIGNYFGGKESQGTGFDVDINIPTQEATTATEGSFAQGGRIGFKEGGPPNPGRRNFMKLDGQV